jgi:hypothetical protein
MPILKNNDAMRAGSARGSGVASDSSIGPSMGFSFE